MAQSPQLATVADTLTPARKKVLVVGATGFLGAKILHNLALEKSAAVVAMSRKGAPSGGDADIEWVRGDMMDPASLDRALEGVDVVVSSANSYMKGSLDTDFQGNKKPHRGRRAGESEQICFSQHRELRSRVRCASFPRQESG